MKPGKLERTRQDDTMCVGRATTVHSNLFYTHTLCMNYLTETFLLVGSLVRSKELLGTFRAKNIEQRKDKKIRTLSHFICIPLPQPCDIVNELQQLVS